MTIAGLFLSIFLALQYEVAGGANNLAKRRPLLIDLGVLSRLTR